MLRSWKLTFDLHFHTQDDGSGDPDVFVKNIANKIAGLFPTTTTLKITAWSQKHNGIRFHARYLITDKAGVALDYGADMGPNRRTDITLLPRAAADLRRSEFDSSGAPVFNLEATLQVSGTR